jgi:glucose/arabinose dehydrogenase
VFHPDYETNGYFYVNYTGSGGHSYVTRFSVTDDPNVADPNSEYEIMMIEQPAPNHNAGQLEFGPDGYMYISWGDGGALSDLFNNAQNGSTLLGSMLRIDVDNASEDAPYGIPADNPFVDDDTFRDEIWAYGVRNPWRFSFDADTGDLYMADVGQGQFEEVNVQPASSSGGENYGWSTTEGFKCYPNPRICNRSGFTLPVAHYDHSQGCSVTGGYVYRGDDYPVLEGIYVFGDYCSGRMWGIEQTSQGWQVLNFGQQQITLSSFGQDEALELYATSYTDGIVYRVVGE